MADNVNIDLGEDFLKKFFGLTEQSIPEGQEITPAIMKTQLDKIEEKLMQTKHKSEVPAATPKEKSSLSSKVNDESSADNNLNPDIKNILIIDDLGVITYQLGVAFKQCGYEVTTSKEIYDAIEKFKKQSFDLVVMDLFIPTEREGLILLEELKKITLNKTKRPKIGIMSASTQKELKQLCKMKGAEFYVEKVDDWQKKLFEAINATGA